MALDYEKEHTKQFILTEYLNSVPYGTVGGQTAVGVQAAARIFFNKPASQLNLQQAALLAGLPQAPSQYNPFGDPREARRRRNEVLSKMAELHYISRRQAAAAPSARRWKSNTAASTRSAARTSSSNTCTSCSNKRYGRETVAQGGLKVYTTIDLHMQHLARKAIGEVLNEPEDPAAAIVTINPANGDIEAMAESESYEKSQYNLAADGHRQPGSTFKAIVLADALSRGRRPQQHDLRLAHARARMAAAVPDLRSQNLRRRAERGDQPRAGDAQIRQHRLRPARRRPRREHDHRNGPQDGRREPAGKLRRRGARRSQARRHAAGDGERLRDPRRRRLAQHARSRSPRSCSRTVTSTRTGANRTGSRCSPKPSPAKRRASCTRTSWAAPRCARRSTARRPPRPGRPANSIDAWLDGYNSEYSTVVWMGYPNRRVSMTDVHGEPQQGGYLPAEIWHAYMAPVTEGHPCAPLQRIERGDHLQPLLRQITPRPGRRSRHSRTKQSESKQARQEAEGARSSTAHARRPQAPAARRQHAPAPEPPPTEKAGGAEPH